MVIQRKGHDRTCPSNFQFVQAKVTPLFCSSLYRRSPANRTMASFLDRGRAVSIARRTSRVSPDRNTDFLAPGALFLLAFRRPAAIDPFRDFIIVRASLDERFEIMAFNTFEPEKHVIERTIEMVFADVAPKERTTFIDRAAQNDVAAQTRFRTARRFFR